MIRPVPVPSSFRPGLVHENLGVDCSPESLAGGETPSRISAAAATTPSAGLKRNQEAIVENKRRRKNTKQLAQIPLGFQKGNREKIVKKEINYLGKEKRNWPH